MKFILSLIVWLGFGVWMVAGILSAFKGHYLCLASAGLVFLALVTKYGCLTHD
jgi:hypothetical protein